MGPVSEIYANWQLAAAHNMESEDVVNAVIRYGSGATGVLQASTAVWPGYPERIEIHGTKGTAIITGDKLTAWDVKDDEGDPAPVETSLDSGASDPMAISLEPIKRQFTDFANAIKQDRRPNCSGEDGYRALEVVLKTYESALEGRVVKL
jgi:predicted dehydrogenase